MATSLNSVRRDGTSLCTTDARAYLDHSLSDRRYVDGSDLGRLLVTHERRLRRVDGHLVPVATVPELVRVVDESSEQLFAEWLDRGLYVPEPRAVAPRPATVAD